MSKSVTFAIPQQNYIVRQPSMNYITRVFDRFLPTSRSQVQPVVQIAPTEQHLAPRPQHQPIHQYHSSEIPAQIMASFEGPWSSDLDGLKSTMQSMPTQYKSSFATTSKETLERINDPESLHVWESDSDIDNLLQLTSVIAKLCNLGSRKQSGASTTSASMLIIAEDSRGRDSFMRICQLIEHLTGFHAKKHFESTVAAYGNIVVVRGWNNDLRSDHPRARVSVEIVMKRINVSIERIFKSSGFSSKKRKIVWHHGSVVHFLLQWINKSSTTHRKALAAITITGSLDLTDSVKPSRTGRTNTISDLQRLEYFAKKLHIPVVFLDASSQLISFPYLAIYMIYYGYYINTFLPPSILHPHLYKAQDELVTFSFQLLGASKGRYSDSVVKVVKKHLDASAAKKWANNCIDAGSYDKQRCKAAGKEEAIDRAGRLADSPLSRFNHDSDISAFARLSIGPTGVGNPDLHTAAPVKIDFRRGRFRPSKPAAFHILVPAKDQDLDKVTSHIQGLMLAVLERVRQEKGNPVIGHGEKTMWKAVVKACTWALDECEGKMPRDIEEKVKSVREKLRKGTWGYVLGAAAGEGTVRPGGGAEGVSDAARANAEASAAYSAAKTMGQQLMAGQRAMGMSGVGGATAPPNSPQMGAAGAMYPQGQGVPPMAYGQFGSGVFADGMGRSYQNGGGGWY